MRKYSKTHCRGGAALFNSFVFILSIVLLFCANSSLANASPVDASFLVDARTGQVLESKNADTITYPASLTKMMTLYLLFEDLRQKKIKFSDKITVSRYAAQMAATNLNLRGGESLDVETAIKALVVRSANDVAAAIGEKLSGSEKGFANRMTKKARALGMTRTRFFNASGLPDERQITTARDMAVLGVALFRDFPEFYHYFSVDKFTYRGVTYTGHNRVNRNYEGADGIKTGFIRLSGFNLVTSAKRNNRRLVGVVLGGDSSFARDQQMQAMLDRGFGGVSKPIGDTLIAKAPAISEAPEEIASADPIKPIQVAAQAGGTDEFDIVSQTILRFQEEQANQNSKKIANAQPGPKAKSTKPAKSVVPLNANTNNGTVKKKPRSNLALASADNYGIQVGAYNKYKPARAAALKAAKSIKRKQSNVVIDQAKNGSASIYRARVAGLSKKEAENACRSLKSKGTKCIVVEGLDTIASQN